MLSGNHVFNVESRRGGDKVGKAAVVRPPAGPFADKLAK